MYIYRMCESASVECRGKEENIGKIFGRVIGVKLERCVRWQLMIGTDRKEA
jgi:hypothetical protein